MCDFRIPFFLDGTPVPFSDVNLLDEDLSKFQKGFAYSAHLTGGWSEYYDGQKFWRADDGCPEITWKDTFHTEVK